MSTPRILVIAGSDISAKVVNWQMATVTGNKSVTGVGLRTGGPPRSPVMLRRPLYAWMERSFAAASRSGPTLPEPEIEQ